MKLAASEQAAAKHIDTQRQIIEDMKKKFDASRLDNIDSMKKVAQDRAHIDEQLSLLDQSHEKGRAQILFCTDQIQELHKNLQYQHQSIIELKSSKLSQDQLNHISSKDFKRFEADVNDRL